MTNGKKTISQDFFYFRFKLTACPLRRLPVSACWHYYLLIFVVDTDSQLYTHTVQVFRIWTDLSILVLIVSFWDLCCLSWNAINGQKIAHWTPLIRIKSTQTWSFDQHSRQFIFQIIFSHFYKQVQTASRIDRNKFQPEYSNGAFELGNDILIPTKWSLITCYWAEFRGIYVALGPVLKISKCGKHRSTQISATRKTISLSSRENVSEQENMFYKFPEAEQQTCWEGPVC